MGVNRVNCSINDYKTQRDIGRSVLLSTRMYTIAQIP